MFGLIQKINMTNPEFGYEKISIKGDLINHLLQTEQAELFQELMNFLALRSSVYTAHQAYAGEAVRISFGGANLSYYYYYLLTEDDWNFITSSSEFAAFSLARDTLFPKFGWVNLGYKKILEPISSEHLTELGLLKFDDLVFVDNLWYRSVTI